MHIRTPFRLQHRTVVQLNVPPLDDGVIRDDVNVLSALQLKALHDRRADRPQPLGIMHPVLGDAHRGVAPFLDP